MVVGIHVMGYSSTTCTTHLIFCLNIYIYCNGVRGKGGGRGGGEDEEEEREGGVNLNLN